MKLVFSIAASVALLLSSTPSRAATIYLCKSYGGGTFWSSATCGPQKATIERMVTVPDGMPFEQQVQLGNQSVQEASKLSAPATRQVTQQSAPAAETPSSSECKTLDEHIRHLDSMARQPQSAYVQDSIATQKRRARERQFQLRCT